METMNESCKQPHTSPLGHTLLLSLQPGMHGCPWYPQPQQEGLKAAVERPAGKGGFKMLTAHIGLSWVCPNMGTYTPKPVVKSYSRDFQFITLPCYVIFHGIPMYFPCRSRSKGPCKDFKLPSMRLLESFFFFLSSRVFFFCERFSERFHHETPVKDKRRVRERFAKVIFYSRRMAVCKGN